VNGQASMLIVQAICAGEFATLPFTPQILTTRIEYLLKLIEFSCSEDFCKFVIIAGQYKAGAYKI
jgi:hypothetical protein